VRLDLQLIAWVLAMGDGRTPLIPSWRDERHLK
jgi:hypothetical protein